MKRYLTKQFVKSLLISILFACPPMMMAQSMTLAQNTPNFNEAKKSNSSQTKRLKEVLNELSQQHQVSILFEDATVQGIMVNPDKIKRGKLESKLDILLKPSNLTYKKVNDNAFVVLGIAVPKPVEKQNQDNFRKSESSTSTLPNQTQGTLAPQSPTVGLANLIKTEIVEQTVSGKITDSESGEGLPGVNVVIKGTQKGTITDTEGVFSIDVPDGNATLIFSFVGYEAQEVLVGNSSSINISMKVDLNTLDEMVVVGYGEQRKKDLTGAVASLQTKDITRANPVQAAKAIQGQVAGATVTKTSNKPGAPYGITIRGENTINNSTEPLIVIDGLMGG